MAAITSTEIAQIKSEQDETAADRGEYRQPAGAFAPVLSRTC